MMIVGLLLEAATIIGVHPWFCQRRDRILKGVRGGEQGDAAGTRSRLGAAGTRSRLGARWTLTILASTCALAARSVLTVASCPFCEAA